MKVSIIIPAYNEEKRIGRTLEAYSKYYEGLRKSNILEYEIVIVINNTKDNTESIVKEAIKRNKRISSLNFKQGGKGFAVIQGFKDALSRDNDLIGFTDADLATPPQAFNMLIKEIKGVDCCMANRYDSHSSISPKFNFRRLIVSQIFNIIVRSLFYFPYRDTQCGAKLLTKEAARFIVNKLVMSQWAFDVEMLYLLHSNNYQTKEISTIWTEVGGSKIDLKKSSLQMLLAIIQLRIINSPFKRILRPFKYPIKVIWKILK